MLRTVSGARVTVLLMSLVGWGCGDASPPGDDSASEPAADALPAGYHVRLDRSNRDPADFRVTASADGLRVTTGPTGILFRTADVAPSGAFAVSATFTEVEAPPGHREGFGLFIGGQDLEGAGQRYTYFLVRADGRYLIKSRTGETTADVSDGWVSNAAIATAGAGDVVNELRVEVADGRVYFRCNGEALAEFSTEDVDARGVVGIRVNHNLDVRVAGFALER